MLDDLVAEVNSSQVELLGSLDVAKKAIEELKKVNPKKAQQLENSLSLKTKNNHSSIINKKRI